MELRKNLRPYREVRELQPPEQALPTREESVAFEVTPQEAPERPQSNFSNEGGVPVLQPLNKGSKARIEGQGAIPPLERVKKTRKVVNLEVPSQQQSSPQPVAEVSAAAEPASAGGEAVAWPFKGEDEPVQDTPIQEPAPPQADPLSDEAQPPVLEIVPQQREIPQLETFKASDAVYMLFCQITDDDSLILLRSYTEKYVRTRNEDTLKTEVFEAIRIHYSNLIGTSFFDFKERRQHRELLHARVTSKDAERGVKLAYVVRDNGHSTDLERQILAGMVSSDAEFKEKAQALTQEPYVVAKWALVKIKIGFDFGAIKIDSLLPDLG